MTPHRPSGPRSVPRGVPTVRSLACATLFAAVPGAAQTAPPAAPGGTGRQMGQGLDSLTVAGPLARTEVWIDGTTRSARAADATVLATTHVTASRPPAMLAEFERRRASRGGRFVTREDLERWRPGTTLEALALVPGVRLVPDQSTGTGFGQTLITIPRALTGPVTSTGCRAAVYVDGVRWSTEVGQPLETVIRPIDIHGIEVHSSLASVPPRFAPPDAGCGVVLIWTRRRG